MINTLALVPAQLPSTPFYRKLLQRITSLFSFSSDTDYSTSSAPSTTKRSKFSFNNKKFFLIPLVILVLLGIFLLTQFIPGNNSTGAVAGVSDSRAKLKKPIATQTLNKQFSFPLKDDTGKVLSQLKVVLTDAEEQDEIILKGQRATSVQGKVFLIIDLKLTNNYSKTIQINTRDYFRLTVNNSDERLAADVHNDPVEVQAISTKYTRLGFPINETDKNLTLYVGEINGPKEAVKLNLK
jgi:hypothetical protein